jgi:hypothetical protein
MIYESFLEKMGVIWAVMRLARCLQFLRFEAIHNMLGVPVIFCPKFETKRTPKILKIRLKRNCRLAKIGTVSFPSFTKNLSTNF